MKNNQGKKAKLVEAAYHWRYQKPENKYETEQLMDKVLVEVYLQFIDEYHKKMMEYNEAIIADDLIRWREYLIKSQG